MRAWSRAIVVAAVTVAVTGSFGIGALGQVARAQEVPGISCGTAILAFPEAGEVVPYSIGTGELGPPIPVSGAYRLTVSADGTTAWVIGDHPTAPVWTLTPVDLATGLAGSSLPLPFLPDAGPVSDPVITPDGATMLIGTWGSVTPIDLVTMTIAPSIPYTDAALRNQIAVVPDGSTLFAASSTSFDLQSVDLSTRTAGPLVAAGAEPIDVTAAPDGSAVYSANYSSGDASVIGTGSLVVDRVLPGLPGNQLIEATADGRGVLVASAWSVARVDLGAASLGPVISPSGAIEGVAALPDGTGALVVTINPNAVLTVDLTTGEVLRSVPLTSGPSGVVAVVPPQAPDASLEKPVVDDDGSVQFDAGESSAACGAIASYSWDFGDGSPEIRTTTAVVDHTYAVSGSYDARVTVTDSSGTSTERVFTGQAVVRNGGPSATADATVDVEVSASVAPTFTG